ncbi:ABC transporter ATP-binding protein [Ureibacillus manganicus]|uniref:Carnitine transport ATP-binding protein OpuCA n=1 Tax=Ureibacillus manganicus DSM 26584 TaxID=1384049 RepID=A0A0A3IB79_9BACL|nr:ABC transporter ATP-binding protein [Ureibacillus manganicus]KGR80073.1 ABC transporter [Ureibacillus manganicus DSM 26584]
MSILEIEGLTFSYSKKEEPVLNDFSMSIEKGEVVGILGRSGSGKSTLLRLISGLEMPSKGTIKVAGTTVVSDRIYLHPENRGVGMVFQDYALFPHMTVKNNILFGLSRLPRNERNQRVGEMLELVKLESFENRYPHELSGGQQQRVALARALAPKPSILLMDEPFSNLDADLKESIREELGVILNKANMTCILVTHDRNDAEAICDRSLMLGLNIINE